MFSISEIYKKYFKQCYRSYYEGCSLAPTSSIFKTSIYIGTNEIGKHCNAAQKIPGQKYRRFNKNIEEEINKYIFKRSYKLNSAFFC